MALERPHQTTQREFARIILYAVCRDVDSVTRPSSNPLTWTDLDRALAQVASSQKNMESITFSMRARQNTNEWAERAAPAVLSRLPVSQANRVLIKVRCYEVGKDGRWPMYPVE